MKRIVVCNFTVFKRSERHLPTPIGSRTIAISLANYVSERRMVGELLLKEYGGDEVSCRELMRDIELFEEV